MNRDTICSVENAKLLKELGFDEIARNMYCADVCHNGKSISFEEELDLRCEGRENEIQYIKYGKLLMMNNMNGEYDDTYAAPTVFEAADWIRRTFDIHITVVPEWRGKTVYGTYTYYFEPKQNDYAKLLTPQYFNSHEDCMQYAIKKVLEYVKSIKNAE